MTMAEERFKTGSVVYAALDGVPFEGRIANTGDSGEYWVRFRYGGRWLKPEDLQTYDFGGPDTVRLPKRIMEAEFGTGNTNGIR